MTMAAAIESRTAETPSWSRSGRIASVEIFGDLAATETVWRSLEAVQHFSTPYQRFDFLGAWQRHAGEREGFCPFIVIGYDGERR
ncbi:MAG: GNAT family N-acetyltransferase, partial [Bradyrhizobium sp.]